jgi:hypothetical protein
MLLSMKNGSTQTNLELGHKHLGREIWGNTVVHGKNRIEERNLHAERSEDRQNSGILGIPVARESPETSLVRRWQWFGERGSGWKEMPRGISTPASPFTWTNRRGGNSSPWGEISGPQNFWVK